MCGIAGCIGTGSRADLEAMLDGLVHRGPDGSGVWERGDVLLGHRRLAIIDLSDRGSQPMLNEDGTLVLVANGEIYNHRALRRDLEAAGHRFRSDCDSEVILHLVEEEGAAAFERLNGMFAVAVWDVRRERLLLARDRLGQKPLYYRVRNGTVVFASEADALTRHSCVPREPDPVAIGRYFLYEHVPTPDCIWSGVRKLPSGHRAIFDRASGSLDVAKFWETRFTPPHDAGEGALLEEFDVRIGAAVQRHLESDVPMGVFLSGGLDSTTVAWYAARRVGRLRTFTVAFGETTFGEQAIAADVARRIGSDHREIPFGPDEFWRTSLDLLPKLDEPFADSSLIPAHFLCREARRHITVALGGEGGDELLVGYPYFLAHQLAPWWRAIPDCIRISIINNIIAGLPTSFRNETWEYRAKKFIEAEGYWDDPHTCQQIWLGAFEPPALERLLKPAWRAAARLDRLFAPLDLWKNEAAPDELLLERMLRQTQRKYLMDDGLTKTDRASMMCGMEQRAPLLDAELVDWVNRIPFRYKYRPGKTKRLLRRLMAGRLPESVWKGGKHGFTPPISQWFAGRFRHEAEEILLAPDPVLCENVIRELWVEHMEGRQDHRKKLWTVFAWKLWSRHPDRMRYIRGFT